MPVSRLCTVAWRKKSFVEQTEFDQDFAQFAGRAAGKVLWVGPFEGLLKSDFFFGDLDERFNRSINADYPFSQHRLSIEGGFEEPLGNTA